VVEKLKRYNVHYTCNCDDECCCGEFYESEFEPFFKVEDMEPILNNLQKLKAKIAALADLIDHANLGIEFMSYKDIASKLRQLSAV